MEIKILHLIEGAREARGLVVVIDVFRAFSVACYVISNGASKIIPVGDIETAYQLKEENPGLVLMGERDGVIQAGFDYGNSPTLIEQVDFTGMIVVHTTSAGTQGLVKASKADEIITGSFVNAAAIVRYIQEENPGQLSLVCMGNAGLAPADEDEFCARYIKNELEGVETDLTLFEEQLRNGSGRRFFADNNQPWSPARDFELCLDYNRFDFVLKAESYQNDLLVLKKV